MKHRPFIFNLGHGAVPETPPEEAYQVSKERRVRIGEPTDLGEVFRSAALDHVAGDREWGAGETAAIWPTYGSAYGFGAWSRKLYNSIC
jgi:hypothetical protein